MDMLSDKNHASRGETFLQVNKLFVLRNSYTERNISKSGISLSFGRGETGTGVSL